MRITTPKKVKRNIATTTWLALSLSAIVSCSTDHTKQPPKLGQSPVEGSPGFGAEVVVNSFTAKAIVVLIDDQEGRIVLKRSDGRQAHCRARPGVQHFPGLKVGDTVSIGVAEELALAMGKSALPPATPEEIKQVRMKVPAGVTVLADALETLTFSAKVKSIDAWNDAVTLLLGDGQTRTIRVSENVNLGDVSPGDDVSVRLTDAVVLIAQ